MEYFSTQKANSVFTWASPEVLSVTGYDNKEIIDMNPYDYFHNNDYSRILQKHIAGLGIINDAEIQTLVYRWRHKNGKFIWCRVKFTNFHDGIICLTSKMSFLDVLFNKIILFITRRDSTVITIK